MANVRTDTRAVLGVVGRRYRVFQNREAFDFMDALVGDRLALYETAGSLHGGRRVWMMARIPKEYRAGSDDLIQPYVLLTNTHDGSQALRMIPTTVRVVCQNTLNLALRGAGTDGLSISHHPRLESRIAEARAKLGIIAARFDTFDDELHAMLAKDLTVTKAGGYFRGLAGADVPGGTERQKRTRERVLGQLLATSTNDRNTLAGVKHTAWARTTRSASGPTTSGDTGAGTRPRSWTGSWIPCGSARPTRSSRPPTGARWNWPASPDPRRPLPEPAPGCVPAGAGWGAAVTGTPPTSDRAIVQRSNVMASYNR